MRAHELSFVLGCLGWLLGFAGFIVLQEPGRNLLVPIALLVSAVCLSILSRRIPGARG